MQGRLSGQSRDTLSLHQLVQVVTHDQLGPEERDSWARTALGCLTEALPGNPSDPSLWSAYDALAPSIASLAERINVVRFATDLTSLLSALGHYMTERGQYAPARK